MSDKEDNNNEYEAGDTDSAPKTGLVAWFHGNHAATNILMLFFLIAFLIIFIRIAWNTRARDFIRKRGCTHLEITIFKSKVVFNIVLVFKGTLKA